MVDTDPVPIAHSLFVGQVKYYAAAALIFYDYFLLFDREVAFIWNCAILLRSEIAHSFVVTTACAVFSALRAFALCDGNNCILGALLLCGIVNPAITLYTLGAIQLPSLMTDPSVTCTLDVAISAEVFENWMIGARVAAIVADVVVLVLTWIRTWSLRVEASRINFNASVTTTLLRNGTWYFIAVLLVNLIGLGFSRSLFLARPLTSWIATLTALLTERFMLDLLEASQGPFRPDTQLPRTAAGWTSLAFCGNSDLLLLGSTQDGCDQSPLTEP